MHQHKIGAGNVFESSIFYCKFIFTVLQACDGSDKHTLETIFSPNFHSTKHAGDETSNGGR